MFPSGCGEGMKKIPIHLGQLLKQITHPHDGKVPKNNDH
jgi:hypothetical protein